MTERIEYAAKNLTVENYRSYDGEVSMRIDDDLTALVGQNDVGKSAMMDTLAIFFETVKPNKVELDMARMVGGINLSSDVKPISLNPITTNSTKDES